MLAHGFPIAQWAADTLQVKVYNVKGLSHWGLEWIDEKIALNQIRYDLILLDEIGQIVKIEITMDRWMDGWMDVQIDIYKKTDKQTNRQTDRYTDKPIYYIDVRVLLAVCETALIQLHNSMNFVFERCLDSELLCFGAFG